MSEAEAPFEALLKELEEIVGRLERGDVRVDEAIALWERGEQLHRLCAARLDTARGAIERLAKEAESSPSGDSRPA